jgi:hypothetical protein
MTNRGTVKLKIGGVSKTLPVKIGLALEIEDETGIGVLALVRQLSGGMVKLRDSLAVLRVALRSNGEHYEDADMLAMLESDGIVGIHKAASSIVTALFSAPAGKTRAGKVEAPSPAMLAA